MTKYKGEFALLFAALIWGTGFVATSAALDRFAPFQLLAIRFIIGALMLTGIFFKKVRALDKITVKYGLILGLFLFLGFACQTFGLQFTTPAKNGFLTAVNVVIVPFIGAIVYRRRVDRYSVLGAFTALAGIALLSLKLDAAISLGDALTLVGAVFFAMHVFFISEFMSRGVDTAGVVVVQTIANGALALLAALVTGQTSFARADLTGLLLLLYLAALATALCFLVQAWAQRFTSETKAAIIMSMECVFGAFFSVILGFESLSLRMFAGALLIVCGLLITEVKPSFGAFGKKAGEEDEKV